MHGVGSFIERNDTASATEARKTDRLNISRRQRTAAHKQQKKKKPKNRKKFFSSEQNSDFQREKNKIKKC